jgi:hypothetical protein
MALITNIDSNIVTVIDRQGKAWDLNPGDSVTISNKDLYYDAFEPAVSAGKLTVSGWVDSTLPTITGGGGSGGGGALYDRELITTMYRCKTAFSGASVNDIISYTQVLDVTDSPTTLVYIWHNTTTGADFGTAPSFNNLELLGSTNLTDAQLRASPVPISGTVTANTGLSQPLTDTQLRASALPISGTVVTGGLTDTQLRATPVPISGTVTANTGLAQAATDAQMRATPIPISGTVSTGGITDTQIRATPLPVSGTISTGLSQPLTDTQLRATPVPVSGTVTANTGLTQPATDAQMRATPIPISGTVSTNGLTDTQLRATPVPISGSVTTGGLTDAQLRASTIPISGSVTTGDLSDAQLRASPVPISGTVTADTGLTQPLTDTQLRAAVVPISGTVTANTGLSQPLTDTQLRASTVPISGTVAVTNASLGNMDTSQGAITDTIAGADGTGNYSIISAIKRGLTNWFSFLTKITPSNGNTAVPLGTDTFIPVRTLPAQKWRVTFAAAVAAAADSTFFNTMFTGSGQTILQTGGNLVMTTGTTTNSETIVRSLVSFKDSMLVKWQVIASQRIVNANLFIEMVDVIGDALTLTVNSATSITVTVPSSSFTAANVGQSIYVGGITSVAGAIPGRYTIASVSGNNITFTVAGWPASGTGTVSLFGWNYHQIQYTGATATNLNFDCQRRGWNSGFTAATINTTASPGHMGLLSVEDDTVSLLDQLIASSTTQQAVVRASRVSNVADSTYPLFLQIRSLNGSTAPASTTTWTVGFVAVDNYSPQTVAVTSVKSQTAQASLPVTVAAALPTGANSIGTVVIGSGTVTTVGAVTSGNLGIPGTIADIASAALTTTTTTAAPAPTFGTSYEVNIPVTVVSGTTPTLDVGIEESDDTGTNWFRVYDFPRIIATGMYRSPKLPLTGNRIRYVQTVSGTTPSFTRAINRLQSSDSVIATRQIIDRTILPNTLNSVTPSLTVQSCRNVQVIVNSGAISTTANAIQLEGSDDFGTTWYSIGSPLTAVASSTVQLQVTNVNTQFLRGRVSTAGTGVTAGYTLIKGF